MLQVNSDSKFEVDDLELPWTWQSKFDFIHSRAMVGSFDNVPKFIDQAFTNLAPGSISHLLHFQTITNDTNFGTFVQRNMRSD